MIGIFIFIYTINFAYMKVYTNMKVYTKFENTDSNRRERKINKLRVL